MVEDYERGYEDGRREGLKQAMRILGGPESNWMEDWRPAAYRCCIVIGSVAFDGRAVRGDIVDSFGTRAFLPEDVIYF